MIVVETISGAPIGDICYYAGMMQGIRTSDSAVPVASRTGGYGNLGKDPLFTISETSRFRLGKNLCWNG